MRTAAVVIGAGHAGLAMSRCLTERSIEHVVLERGEVANTWKIERWDSLRLLTPNWQSRLPGYGYEGDDPGGFRTIPETIDFIERYAEFTEAPVRTHTTVTSVRAVDDGYEVVTDRGTWQSPTVVLASGACNVARVPEVSAAVPPDLATLTAQEYKNPEQLGPGGVLVVGPSSTGTQIADEIHRSGRPVTLSVGEHVRVPRSYRGLDIECWMEAIGLLDERWDEIENLVRARRLPSLQLTGSPEGRMLDLNALTAIGVSLIGRMTAIRGRTAQFSGSLPNMCALADLKMDRLLDRIDEWAVERGLDGVLPPPHRFEPTRVEASPPLSMDLGRGEIRTILWATGFRPDHSWVDLPVFDRKGRIRHDGGVVAAPGVYLMGMPVLRRRKSSLIDGAGDDARDLSAHLAWYLGGEPGPGPERVAGIRAPAWRTPPS